MQVRKHLYFSGYVQGVGFRYKTLRLASSLGVLGFVRNLADGRVEVVVEAEQGTVADFLASLRHKMSTYIQHVDEEDETPCGEFSTFEVAYDWG
jgi:acylphosphatase